MVITLGIFCAGNLGREIYDMAFRINQETRRWREIVFVDNYPKTEQYYQTRVYRLTDWADRKSEIEFVIANGEPGTRRAIYDQLKEGRYCLTSLIDPTAILSPTAVIGEGCIIAPFSAVSSDVVLGENVLIQSYIRVGHDIRIGSHSVVSSNCAIGGGAKIGEEVFLGMGAAVREELKIGDGAVLAMGGVLFKDLAAGMTAVGNPARITKGNEEGRVFRS